MDDRIYIFPDTASAAERLNLQHRQCEVLFGNAIPDTIINSLCDNSTRNNEPIKIHDVATGSAIWAIDQAKRLADLNIPAVIHGSDIDTNKFPSKADLPSNVTLSISNMLEPPSPDKLGFYDIVHVRFVIFCIKGEQYPNFVQYCFDMLKPGGYIMWEDCSFDVETGTKNRSTIHPHEIVAEKYWDTLLNELFIVCDKRDISMKSTMNIPKTLENEGFVDVVEKIYHSIEKQDGDLNKLSNVNYICCCKEFYEQLDVLPQEKRDALGLRYRTMAEADVATKGLENAWRGSETGIDWVDHVIYARKPAA